MHYSWSNLLKVSPDVPLQTVMQSASQQAEEINRITIYFFIASGFILLVVLALTTFVVYRFRESKVAHYKPGSISKKWEIAMIGVPTALVGLFLYYNITTIQQVEPDANGHQPDVIITAHQWWWEASYPIDKVVTANEIHLPAGKKILLQLRAADVIHDWWIPSFGNKMDMVPKQVNHLWLTIKQPGEYYGICSEFCGAQHAHMRIKVIAHNADEYNRWLHQHKHTSLASTETIGAQLFMQKTCGNCHRINGTNANGVVGPDLTHLASRATILAGLLNNTPQNLENWIRHPQTIKPGAYMPDFHLDDTTVKHIAAYLYSLK